MTVTGLCCSRLLENINETCRHVINGKSLCDMNFNAQKHIYYLCKHIQQQQLSSFRIGNNSHDPTNLCPLFTTAFHNVMPRRHYKNTKKIFAFISWPNMGHFRGSLRLPERDSGWGVEVMRPSRNFFLDPCNYISWVMHTTENT